jgi:hypothetical protein
MLLFPKKDIIPIIIPEICFHDKYNDINSYAEMNPSINIDEDGNIIILVRCINYKKYSSKAFTLYDMNSNSIYYILNGKIHDDKKMDIENFDYQILEYNYNLPTFPTYWKGLEDIRFVDKETILVNVPQLHQGGKPSLFKAQLNNNIIQNFVSCNPCNNSEKNWMPYFDYTTNTNKVIYSLSPFIIKSIENEDVEEVELSENIRKEIEGYHGSTNGIQLNKYERLFLIHINKEKTIHRWLLFHTESKSVFVSEEFIFFKNSYIEFNCSLTKYNDRIFISIGVNDNKAFIIETTYEDILYTFKKNNEEKYPTIVTMLYDIRSMEKNSIERNRKLESFVDFSKQFLLKLPYPIIFFIDDNPYTYDIIFNFRKELNLLDKTYICIKDFKKTYFYKDLKRLEELQTKFFIINGELEHETPLYVILNNNKFDCINDTIHLNPFNSSHFIWMDFGINHVAQSTNTIFEWIDKVPDKIKQLCINPYTEVVDNKQMFQYIYHHTAGGLFSGSKENMLKYAELFKQKTEEIYADDWYQIDEAVMTMVQRENPDLFDFFYGDYQGIVSNYIKPIHNIDLILRGCQKCIDASKTKEAFHILIYCIDYFFEHLDNDLLYLFLHQNIIVDYNNNNKMLLEKIIYFINSKLTSDNPIDKEKIHTLLNNNKANIDLYENKEKIMLTF